jgi:hypothetical protein
MLELAIWTIILSFVFLFIGHPWVGAICGDKLDKVSRFFWDILFGIASSSILVSFAIGINIDLRNFVWFMLFFSLVGWVVQQKLRSTSEGSDEGPHARDWIIVIPAISLCFLFLSFGTAQDLTESNQSFRIGPDAIGNATASSALQRGQTIQKIRERLWIDLPQFSQEEILAPALPKFYQTDSIQLQVETEFLVAGLRWGFSGVTAMVLVPGGIKDLWVVMNSLVILAILTTAIGIWSFCRRMNLNCVQSLAGLLSIVFSVTILNSWREGGLAQMWILPGTIGVIWLLRFPLSSKVCNVLLIAVILGYSLTSYSDVVLLMVPFLFIFLVLRRFLEPNNLTSPFVWLCGAFSSLVLVLPFTLHFIPYVSRRLGDASSGGWSLPVWTTFSEGIGFINTYNQLSPSGLIPRGLSEQSISLFLDLVLLAGLVAIFVKRRLTFPATIFTCLILLVGMRMKTQFLDHSTNYQYFKTFGCLLPIFIASYWSSLFSVPMLKRSQVFSVLLCLAPVSLLVGSSLDYEKTFAKSSTQLPVDFHRTQSSRDLNWLDGKNYLAVDSLQFERLVNIALAPYTSGNWIGRYAISDTVRLERHSNLPLVLLVNESSCPNWLCIESVPKTRLKVLSSELIALQLLDQTRDAIPIASVSSNWKDLVSRLLNNIGGPDVDEHLVPVPNRANG